MIKKYWDSVSFFKMVKIFLSLKEKNAHKLSVFLICIAPTLDEKYVYQGQYQGQKWDEIRCDLVHKVFQLLERRVGDLNPCTALKAVRRISSPLHYHSANSPKHMFYFA